MSDTDHYIDLCQKALAVITIGHIGSDANNRYCVYRGDGRKGFGPTLKDAYEAFLEDAR